MLIALWTKMRGWLVGAGVFLAALGAAVLYGRAKGKAAEQGKTRDAQEAATAATEQVKANEVRHEVEVETARLPDAPPQKVADADPASAAGKLRDDGWVR